MERNFPIGKKFYFAVPETALIYIEWWLPNIVNVLMPLVNFMPCELYLNKLQKWKQPTKH